MIIEIRHCDKLIMDDSEIGAGLDVDLFNSDPWNKFMISKIES